MDQKIEREWKSIVCPERKGESLVMFEWDILSNEGRILKKTLKQIDCHNPELAEFGGTDCSWACSKAIAKREKTGSRTELLLVCAAFIVGILWIVFYDLYLKRSLHLYGLLVFFGLPLLIILTFSYTWKMMRHFLRPHADPSPIPPS